VRGDAGRTQVTPLGVRQQGDWVVLGPFKPSLTWPAAQSRAAVITAPTTCACSPAASWVGAIGRWCLPRGSTASGRFVPGARGDSSSPSSSTTRSVRSCAAARFTANACAVSGFQPAQAAVIEAAILVSRLSDTARGKLEAELEYLKIRDRQDRGRVGIAGLGRVLMEAIAAHRDSRVPDTMNRSPQGANAGQPCARPSCFALRAEPI